MLRSVHFEIHTEDPERATRFYEGLFAWKFSRWGEQVLVPALAAATAEFGYTLRAVAAP